MQFEKKNDKKVTKVQINYRFKINTFKFKTEFKVQTFLEKIPRRRLFLVA